MGAHGFGRNAEVRVQPLAAAAADRLYGRQRGHTLRTRQHLLLAATLPRLRFDPALPLPNSLWLEIGFGSGEHAQALSQGHPDTLVVACEVFENGICSLLSRLVAEGAEQAGPLPANLKIWDHDARALLRLLPPQSLDRLFLMFPDPWPKNRHVGRRFVSPENIALAANTLRPGGLWRIASDDPTYQAWVTDIMRNQNSFTGPPPFLERPHDWPPTRYEAKALRAGRRPLYWEFTRKT